MTYILFSEKDLYFFIASIGNGHPFPLVVDTPNPDFIGGCRPQTPIAIQAISKIKAIKNKELNFMELINRTRTERLTLRLSTDEKNFIIKQKEKSKCPTFTEFFLKLAVNSQINVIDTKPLFEIAAELNKIGVNINQIAKIANTARNISLERINFIRMEIDRMSFMIDNIIKQFTPKK